MCLWEKKRWAFWTMLRIKSYCPLKLKWCLQRMSLLLVSFVIAKWTFYIIILHIKKLFGLLLPSNLINLNSVGGGIAGCNTLYQLTKRGVNAVLLERAKLTSGTTWHTAGKFKYPFFVQYIDLYLHYKNRKKKKIGIFFFILISFFKNVIILFTRLY